MSIAAYEAKVSRTGATAGEVPVLQADNTLAFGAVSGTSEGFRAYRSATQALAAATHTKIVFNTENRDEGAGYDTATGDWTVPATGWYDVASGLYFSNLADGERSIVTIYVNGATGVLLQDDSAGAAQQGLKSGSTPMYLTAGDVVSIYAYRGAAGDIGAGSAQTWFTAKRRY